METLRIAIISENLPPARLNLQPWRYLGDLGKALQAQGHETSVVTGDDAPQTWESLRVEGRVALADFRSGPALRRLVDARRFDAGIFRLTAGLFISLRRSRGTPRSAGRMAGIFLRPLHSGSELARRFLDPRLLLEMRMDVHHAALYSSRVLGTWPLAPSFVDHFMFLWESDRACAISAGLPSTSCTVIRHPFDPFFRETDGADLGPRLSDILSPVERRIVFSGPPEETRGVHEVLSLAAILPRDPPTQVVLMIRDRSQAVPTVARSRSGPHEIVVVRGLVTRDELRAAYRHSHVAVFPYRFVRTGLPLVALEAAAAGLPVVTTRVHPLRELEGATGLVFANPRDPRDLARAIQSVFEGDRAAEVRHRNEEWIRSTPDWKSVAGTFVSALRG
jgi:glycosyltransferase involved in cell wall biosynthesis